MHTTGNSVKIRLTRLFALYFVLLQKLYLPDSSVVSVINFESYMEA